jgi:molybdate transport system substrate-binding protein
VAAAGVAAALLTGCGSSSGGDAAASGSPSAQGVTRGSITVFAAASLQGSFTKIGQEFQASHPGDKVTFSFGPSSGLATQIVNGAPADVFASAAPANMKQVVQAGDARKPADFAKNIMEVAVPPSNPAKVSSVTGLAKSSVKVALCQPQVPCGVTAHKVFKKANVSVKPATLEPDVKSVLTQVELGNVDAGMVYVTDVMAAGSKVKGVTVPQHMNASTTYPIAPVSKGRESAVARDFVAYVMSSPGQQILAQAGFEKP